MRKGLLIVLVLGLLALLAYWTKPTPEDFYHELKARAGEAEADRTAGFLPRGSNSLDRVVGLMSPEQALEYTRHGDYGLVSVFTVEYPKSPGVYERVYATGVYGTFVVVSQR